MNFHWNFWSNWNFKKIQQNSKETTIETIAEDSIILRADISAELKQAMEDAVEATRDKAAEDMF